MAAQECRPASDAGRFDLAADQPLAERDRRLPALFLVLNSTRYTFKSIFTGKPLSREDVEPAVAELQLTTVE